MKKDIPMPQPLPVLNPIIEAVQQDVKWLVLVQRNRDYMRKLRVNDDDEKQIARGSELWRALTGYNVRRAPKPNLNEQTNGRMK